MESGLGRAGILYWTGCSYLADGSIAFSTVCMVFAEGNLLGNIVFFLQVPPSGRSPDTKASASRDDTWTSYGNREYRFFFACPASSSSFCGCFYPKLGSVGLRSKNRELCFLASSVKQGYYAQNYARPEVQCSNYAGLKWHFHPTPDNPAPMKTYLVFHFWN